MNINTTSQIDAFKEALERFYNNIKDNKGTEENIKNHINSFLIDAFYNKNEYDINTTDKIDSRIKRIIDDATLVIIEVKRPVNTNEMYSDTNRNCKALHELLRYFDREYYGNNNKNITYLIITDGFNWYFFDAKKLIKLVDTIRKHKNYKSYNDKIGAKNTTDKYYDMAKECLNNDDSVYHNDYYSIDNRDDESIIKLYNILHPSHLLKDNSAYTDSNILDERFYNELLYLMGLYENGDKIERRRENEREKGSLIELIYSKLGKDKNEEELFDTAFGLCVLWINRMLFIKLLEARLLEYYEKDGSKKILHTGLIKDFSSLSTLFFNILGTKIDERDSIYTDTFGHIPYLNSLLFEEVEETEPMNISRLDNGIKLPYYTGTLIKNTSHTNSFLGYFFDFLESYNFSYDEDKKTQDDEKPLMTASVLGLVFEKLNGYKEGSFYTPSFITAYMCDDVLEMTVVDKYNKELNKDYKSIIDIQNDIHRDHISITTAREIYNKIRVLDPSVGSGHFSVATLNKLLMMKYELGLLEYNGSAFNKKDYRLKNYKDDIYLYYKNEATPSLYTQDDRLTERQKIQEILFHEKQCIIENNIFGVDINHNSVHICQLRLWIELLKHAYFREDNTMETLPNIDINIKEGDSLFARNSLSIDIKNIDGGSNIDMEAFRNDIVAYRKESNKKARKDIEDRINRTEEVINKNAVDMQCKPDEAILAKVGMFGDDKLLKQEKKEAQERINTIREDELWTKSFEWRYKFPEVLDIDTGAFIGFDCIIGNPPYLGEKMNAKSFEKAKRSTLMSSFYVGKMDLFYFFFYLAYQLLREGGIASFITTNYYPTADSGNKLRVLLRDKTQLINISNFNKWSLFTSARGQHNMITTYKKTSTKDDNGMCYIKEYIGNKKINSHTSEIPTIEKSDYRDGYRSQNDIFRKDDKAIMNFRLQDDDISTMLDMMDTNTVRLVELVNINQGIVSGADTISNNHIKDYPHLPLTKGAPVYVYKRDELSQYDLASAFIKPFYKNSDIHRYSIANDYTKEIAYLDERIMNLDDYPIFKKHIYQYKEILDKRREKNSPYLHWAREQSIFEREKIVVPKWSKTNTFGYTTKSFYASTDVCFITHPTEEVSIKYLLGILNSQCVYNYLFYKGKRKGDALELMAGQLKDIPIPIPTDAQKKALEELVDKRLEVIDSDMQQQLEDDIEVLVRVLYGIS